MANTARPNILWYCADQQRYDTIGAINNPHVSTPHIDKLVASGFIEFKPDKEAAAAGATYQATLTDNGAIAQGRGAMAAGTGGVVVGGRNTGPINTGTQTNIDIGAGAHTARFVHMFFFPLLSLSSFFRFLFLSPSLSLLFFFPF